MNEWMRAVAEVMVERDFPQDKVDEFLEGAQNRLMEKFIYPLLDGVEADLELWLS